MTVTACSLALTVIKNEHMQIEFTHHALARMVERGISRDEVLATLDRPLCIVNAQNDGFEA